MSRWVWIDAEPPVELYPAGAFDRALLTAPLRLPRLTEVGVIRRAARIGGTTGETGSVAIKLDNGDGELSRRWSFPPILRRAEVRELTAAGTVRVLFAGRLRSVALGADAELTVQA